MGNLRAATVDHEASAGNASGRSEAIVAARSLVKDYDTPSGTRRAIDNLTLTVPAGRFVSVMGRSGSGKSTLLHLLGGLITPTSGDVLVDGRSLSGLADDELAEVRRRRVGFIFQAFNLVPVLDVAENVALPATIAGEPARSVAKRAAEVLALVGLEDRASEPPSQLSGGEQQRVAIARSLIMSPAVLLADEPTGNLDSTTAVEVLMMLKQVQSATSTSVVLVTHDARAAAFADEVLLLRDGRLADRLLLDGWTLPEAEAITHDRFGDDRTQSVLEWLQQSEPRRTRRARRRS